MLENLKPLTDRWYVFLPILALVAALYLLERAVRGKALKTVFSVLNLLTHAALFALCLVFDTGADILLLLILCAVLIGLLTEGGRKNGI